MHPCIRRQSLNYWTTREVPSYIFSISNASYVIQHSTPCSAWIPDLLTPHPPKLFPSLVSSIHPFVQTNNHATIFKASFSQTPSASLASCSSKPYPKSMRYSLLPTISLVQMTVTSHLNYVMRSHPNHTSYFFPIDNHS